MEEIVTKEDLKQFGMLLMDTMRKAIQKVVPSEQEGLHPGWLKSRAVRKLMDMSPGSLQNLRVTGKVRYKKILGSYYYNKLDLEKLFDDEHSQ